MLETAEQSSYQRIAAKAKQPRRLGMSRVQIARALSISDKTVAKALRWGGDSRTCRASEPSSVP